MRSLDRALEHMAAIEHLPTPVARDLHAGAEAIQRIRTRLDLLSRVLARPGRSGPVPDIYESLALHSTAQFFQGLGLRPTTTPAGLFVTVATTLLGEVHPRDLMKAIKAVKR